MVELRLHSGLLGRMCTPYSYRGLPSISYLSELYLRGPGSGLGTQVDV